MYDNTSDLVAVLNHRGYHGRFLFFDYMSGLDDDICGLPRWAIWFSIIAQHSDLVIFVKRFETDLGPAQLLESRVIPDWVPKSIEEIPIEMIQSAATPQMSPGIKREYWTQDGPVGIEEWNQQQRDYSAPFIANSVRGNIPKDRFVHMREDGTIREYPLSFELFA